MVKKTNTLGSTKRFGTRYGKTTKLRYGKIESQQKSTYKCPYCNYNSVKRVQLGIWECNKCDKKFAGKAYTITKKSTKSSAENVEVSEEVEEEKKEEVEEDYEEDYKKRKKKKNVVKVEDDEIQVFEEAEENPQDSEDFGEE